MKATQALHDLGQSLWLDNITRDLLDNGTLKSYIDELVGDRAHVESHHLRPSHRQERFLRCVHPGESRARRNPLRRCSSIWRWRT